jgi:hypothetical protein
LSGSLLSLSLLKKHNSRRVGQAANPLSIFFVSAGKYVSHGCPFGVAHKSRGKNKRKAERKGAGLIGFFLVACPEAGVGFQGA